MASPFRRSGPSVEEAAASVAAMKKEADDLLDEAFYNPKKDTP